MVFFNADGMFDLVSIVMDSKDCSECCSVNDKHARLSLAIRGGWWLSHIQPCSVGGVYSKRL